MLSLNAAFILKCHNCSDVTGHKERLSNLAHTGCQGYSEKNNNKKTKVYQTSSVSEVAFVAMVTKNDNMVINNMITE